MTELVNLRHGFCFYSKDGGLFEKGSISAADRLMVVVLHDFAMEVLVFGSSCWLFKMKGVCLEKVPFVVAYFFIFLFFSCLHFWLVDAGVLVVTSTV